MSEENMSWCWLGIHDWTKWQDLETYKIIGKDKKWIGVKYTQQRRCKNCNKLQVNEQETLL